MSSGSVDTMPQSLRGYNIQRTQREEEAVCAALRAAAAVGERISFNSIAQRSGVSRSTLYRNEALRTLVEEARSNQENRGAAAEEAIAAMRQQVAALQDQVRELSEKLDSLESKESGNSSARCSYVDYTIMRIAEAA